MIKTFAKYMAVIAITSLPGMAHAFSPVRNVQISTNTLTRQSGTAVIAGVDVSTATISSATVTNLSVSSMTSTLPMSNRKITGLSSGTVNTDAATYGQVGLYSVLCSSTVVVSSATTVSTFVPSKLGCTASLSNAAHHVYIVSNVMIQGTVSGNAYAAAIAVDGVNLDDSTWGQCAVDFTVAGISVMMNMCPLVEYYAPGDTNAHAYRVYFAATSGVGTATLGISSLTQRFIVFEVQ